MLEERNIYWDYNNDSSKWRSKKFMDFENELKPKKISTTAYSKRRIFAKKPLWIIAQVDPSENIKIAASKIGSSLISVAFAPYQALDVFFNEKKSALLFVLDCQYLIESVRLYKF